LKISRKKVITVKQHNNFSGDKMKSFTQAIIVSVTLLLGSVSLAHEGHTHPLAGHLSYKNNTLHIHASFPVTPVLGQEATLVLEAKEAATHQAVALTDKVSVVLWMPSMGHGSAPTVVENAVDTNGNLILGSYNVHRVFFIMGGDWEVRVTLTAVDGKSETQVFKVNFASDDHGHKH
jgi:YtkA-like